MDGSLKRERPLWRKEWTIHPFHFSPVESFINWNRIYWHHIWASITEKRNDTKLIWIHDDTGKEKKNKMTLTVRQAPTGMMLLAPDTRQHLINQKKAFEKRTLESLELNFKVEKSWKVVSKFEQKHYSTFRTSSLRRIHDAKFREVDKFTCFL